MTQPYPGPQQQPQHGHPQWAQPQPGQAPYGQPYAGGPAPYQPPPQPPKKMSTGKIVAITLGSVFGGLILLGVLVGGGDDSSAKASGSKASATTAVKKPAGKADAKPADKPAAKPKPEPAPEAPVKVTATKTAFAPSILHDGGAFTSVKVTVTNNGDETIGVNPLYFTITDTDGSKHTAELGEDENQIDTVDLAPGEKVTGVITGKGKFTAKYVTYTDGLFGDGIRGNVS